MSGIEFRVDGLPPIKRGSQSMWGKQIARGPTPSVRSDSFESSTRP